MRLEELFHQPIKLVTKFLLTAQNIAVVDYLSVDQNVTIHKIFNSGSQKRNLMIFTVTVNSGKTYVYRAI